MNAPEVVRRYAATLADVAAETQIIESVQGDAERLVVTLRQSEELVSFLKDRLISAPVQVRVLEELFAGKVQELTLNFLLLMAQRRRANLLPEALEAFLELVAERAGIVSAEVRSTAALSAEQEERLREGLAACTGKSVRLQVRVDEGLGGGLIARVGDTVFDGSLATQLERLHRHLVGA